MITKRVERRLMRLIGKTFNVRVHNADLRDCAAQADTENALIEVGRLSKATRACFISCLLHEAVHIEAYRKGIFKAYHAMRYEGDMSVTELRRFLATAWRAERWVEKKARELMAEMFPGELYWFSYGRRKIVKPWFDQSMLESYRTAYRKKKLRAIDRSQRGLQTHRQRNRRSAVQGRKRNLRSRKSR